MPMATTDSPMATMMTRPWRSTKWPGAMVKPLSSISLGVIQTRQATAHRTYCAVPPAMPPARTSNAIPAL